MSSFLALTAVTIIVAASVAFGRPSEGGVVETLSVSFALGQSFSGTHQIVANTSAKNDFKIKTEKMEDDCRRRVADQLYGKLRAAGFFIERQFLAQIGSENLRDKMCRIYAAETHELAECLLSQEGFNEHVNNPPILRLLDATCDTYNNAIQHHAECIADVGGKMERECGVACRQKMRDNALAKETSAEFMSAITTPTLSDAQADGLCRVGMCAIRCVSAQLGECESEANGEVGKPNESVLRKFYENVSALQMLVGLESVQRPHDASATVKSGKLPPKCQQFLQKFDNDEKLRNSATHGAGEQISAKLKEI